MERSFKIYWKQSHTIPTLYFLYIPTYLNYASFSWGRTNRTHLKKSLVFDTVDQNILLKKLQIYGIVVMNYKWCKKYLTDRKQYIQVNHEKPPSLETVETVGSVETNTRATLFSIICKWNPVCFISVGLPYFIQDKILMPHFLQLTKSYKISINGSLLINTHFFINQAKETIILYPYRNWA